MLVCSANNLWILEEGPVSVGCLFLRGCLINELEGEAEKYAFSNPEMMMHGSGNARRIVARRR
jgi:hypothetical protein